MEIILLCVCDVLSIFYLFYFFATGFALVCHSAVGASQLCRKVPDSFFFPKLAAELLAETLAVVSFPHQLPFAQIHWISYWAVTGHDLFLSAFLVMMPEILHLKVGLQYPCSEKAFILFAVQHRDSKLHVGRHKEPSSVECSLLTY